MRYRDTVRYLKHSPRPAGARGKDDTMLLEIDGLAKAYRKGARANDGISLSVEAGEVYGLLGHNGAGKTTLVNQVVGLLKPDAGRIHIGGHDIVADPGCARRACSIQPQATLPIDGLTPRQAIELVGRIRGASAIDVRARRRSRHRRVAGPGRPAPVRRREAPRLVRDGGGGAGKPRHPGRAHK